MFETFLAIFDITATPYRYHDETGFVVTIFVDQILKTFEYNHSDMIEHSGTPKG